MGETKGEIVNLRRARKEKARAASRAHLMAAVRRELQFSACAKFPIQISPRLAKVR
jgi:hypothetical protein